jgi:aminopeptidase N
MNSFFIHTMKNKQMNPIKFSVFILFSGIICIWNACTPAKKISEVTSTDFSEELLDTLFVTPEGDLRGPRNTSPSNYKPSATIQYDLIHTSLDLRFDWQNMHVFGKAALTLKPFFRPLNIISLDAVNFDIQSIAIKDVVNPPVFQYDGQILTIELPRSYSRDEEFTLLINYIAKPNATSLQADENGDTEKGLYFINHDGKANGLPMQIWTQGQTQNNSKWFPTFDHPNERCTQEVKLTVGARFKTLSNGKLMSSVPNEDGTRTDHWYQSLPHPPYLFMVAVGEYHEEKEMWNNIPLHYFVEKRFAPFTKKIFNHTPEMLSFFSEKLQYPYPWDKYAQISVRDYTSGAMENTGAVVFNEFVQKNNYELADNDNDYIVAHELFHHWFGNLVTCESWSNLTLNEGFANYGEYLWFEHKYGKDRADFHRLNELIGYISEVMSVGPRPAIDYYYASREGMFDAHSYNKGGMILHMLRNYVGDEAFFASLNKYLKENAFTAVEVDELRMAFEDTTGEDLNWFFDQWFLQSGHPELQVEYQYDEIGKNLTVSILQTQDSITYPNAFVLPIHLVMVMPNGDRISRDFRCANRECIETIENVMEKPAYCLIDGRGDLLAIIDEIKTQEELLAQYRGGKSFMEKYMAVIRLEDKSPVLDALLQEPFYVFRSEAISYMDEATALNYTLKLQELAMMDPHAEVRALALYTLLNMNDESAKTLCKRLLDMETSYTVMKVALEGLKYFSPEDAISYAKKLYPDASPDMAEYLMEIFAQSTDESLSRIFDEQMENIRAFKVTGIAELYQIFLSDKSYLLLSTVAEKMTNLATQKTTERERKIAAAGIIIRIQQYIEERPDSIEKQKALAFVQLKLDEILRLEKDEEIRQEIEALKN